MSRTLLQTFSKAARAEKNCHLRAKIILQHEQINKRHFCSTIVKKLDPTGINCKMNTWDLWQLEPLKNKLSEGVGFPLFPVSLWHTGYERKMDMWDGVEFKFSSLKAISQRSSSLSRFSYYLLIHRFKFKNLGTFKV